MKILDLKELFGNKWIHLFQATWEHLEKRGLWFFVSRKPNPHGPQARPYDAVIVVPILTEVHSSLVDKFEAASQHRVGFPTWTNNNYFTLEKPHLVVTSEFRIPINDYEYGFVAGLPDGKETSEETAARELLEETGLEMIKAYKVSPPMYSSGGLTDESVVMVFCTCRAPENFQPNPEASEDIKLHLLNYKGLGELMKKPLKFAGKAWPVLHMFETIGLGTPTKLTI